MKAFKTFIASAIACALILSMATSAFAAVTVDTNSVVSADAVESVTGERTVLVVPRTSWNGTALVENPEIVYINQVDDGILANTLAAMAGKNLTHGDYRVLVGNKNGTVDVQEFTAIKVVANTPGESVDDVTPVSWEVTMNSNLLAEDLVVAKFYDKNEGAIEGAETTLWWDTKPEITGSGVYTFTAETEVDDADVGVVQLEISSGTVSNKN